MKYSCHSRLGVELIILGEPFSTCTGATLLVFPLTTMIDRDPYMSYIVMVIITLGYACILYKCVCPLYGRSNSCYHNSHMVM